MKNKLIILLLLFLTVSSAMKAQNKEHSYIPLFDTNKVWYTVKADEFEGWDVRITEIDYENNVCNINDTLYYLLSGYGYYREDTLTKKVYKRDCYNPQYPEMLIYDFSLNDGDSTYLPSSYLWLYVDSIKTETFFEKERRIFYLTNKEWDNAHPVWIEGVGSLAGLPYPQYPPEIYWLAKGELTCCYDNDTLVYQSEYGELYGCSFEYLSINEFAIDNEIRIFPNPIDETTVIQINDKNIADIEVVIYDVLGNIVSQTTTNQRVIPLNTDLQQGIYFVNITFNNYSITKKIIKL
jgi:Secretion system C-terminal sorting domain